MGALLLVGGAYALASFDWCGAWPTGEPALLALGAAQGRLRAAAARVELSPPYPVVLAGYPPPRSEADRASHGLHARALVIEVESMRVGLVSLDLLLVPEPIAEAIRSRTESLGFSDLWVAATHTHSSFGGYDPRLVAEISATGRYREAAQAAVVQGAVQALTEARAKLRPTSLQSGEGSFPELVSARTGDLADQRITRLLFRAGSEQLAQVVVFAAHPTLVPRKAQELSPDYPGLVASELEKEGGVALLLQGAVGNGSVAEAADFVPRLAQAVRQVPLSPAGEDLRFGYARTTVALPRPDGTRLFPSAVRSAGENLLCRSAPHAASLSSLRLGPVKLLAVPGELTLSAALRLEADSRASRAISLVNGYLGYVESPGQVNRGEGESRRQYFGPGLLEVLCRGGELAGSVFLAASDG